MKTFALAAIAGLAAAGNIFETLHSVVDDAEHLIDDA